MKCFLFNNKIICLWLILGFSFIKLTAQETNSRASGRVFFDNKETAAAVTIIIIHEPTQNKYFSQTDNDGYFHFFNLKPGGPYSIFISCAGYDTLRKSDLYIHLIDENFSFDNSDINDFVLQKKVITLGQIVIDAKKENKNKTGIETNIPSSVLRAIPTINRSLQDFVRLVPQAKVNGEGVMSLAGQNNRFNAFFIDGANNTDIKGLSVNGMNGGQTGTPPVSI